MPITHNIRDLERGLNDFARRQIPFAVSVAINDTLADVKRNADKGLEKRLDRPTPFTKRAFRVRRSSKSRLKGAVAAQPVQEGYLDLQEEGGVGTPKKRAIAIPVGLRRNSYGNMARGALGKAIAKRDTFVPGRRSHLPGGVYQRTRRGLKMLATFVSRTSYRPRLRFRAGAQKTADARLPRHLAAAMARAMATARR